MEKLQERALRFVFNDSHATYEELLEKGKFLPLSIYRLRFLAIEVYKSITRLSPPYMNDLFNSRPVKYILRDSHHLQQPKFNTYKYGFKSFRYYGAKLWNSLPTNVKYSKDINEFKKNVTEWCSGTTCRGLEIF